MKLIYRNTALLLLSLLLLGACNQAPCRRVASVFDDVESYINEHPDSALAVLQGVDSTSLTTRALWARYSLLRTMAFDKCYKDITGPGLLDPAVGWYVHHGSADEKMKTLYYQGRIEQDKGNLTNAAVLYTRAEEYAEEVTDKHALGLLYLAEASVYNTVYNLDVEEEYVNKALDVFRETEDPIYGSALGDLALVFHSRKKWEKADSLYRIAILNSGNYPHAKKLYLSNYARMKLLQPNKDPVGAIQLLDQKRTMSAGVLSPIEAGAYAYASVLRGDNKTSNSLSSRLLEMSGASRKQALPWLYRIALFKEESEESLALLQEMRLNEDAEINAVLSDSVTKAIQDYYELFARSEREKRLRSGICALAVIILLMFLVVVFLLRERRMRMERDRLLGIRADLEQELKDQETRTATLSGDFASRLAQLRRQLREERLERLRKSGQYGYWIWMEQKGRSSDANVTKALRKDLSEICALERDSRALERRIDQELDGVVSHLKDDLGIVDRPEEVSFLCCWLIGLKPDMIAELLGISTNNVYVKSYRLEERIRKLDKPEYAPLFQK